jgi:hypothetical protein
MKVETKDAFCGVCGQSPKTADPGWDWENDLEEGTPDTELPQGWVQVIVRRVVPNPMVKTIDGVLDEMVSQVPAHEQAAARAALRQQAEAVVAIDTEPEGLLDEVEMTVCSTCAYTSDAIARLASVEPEAFQAAEWFVMSTVQPVEPEKEPEEDGKEGPETVPGAVSSEEEAPSHAGA